MKQEDTMQKYTLGCVHCGESYYSTTAFPERLLCPDCRGLRKAGMEEVVRWITDNDFDMELPWSMWQAKLKEWGIEIDEREEHAG